MVAGIWWWRESGGGRDLVIGGGGDDGEGFYLNEEGGDGVTQEAWRAGG